MKPIRGFVLYSIILFFCLNLYSQEKKYIQQDYDFALYLIGNSLKEEAKALVDDIDYESYFLNSGIVDSINFLKGWILYSNKELVDASAFFEKVNQTSNLYTKANLYNAISNAYIGDYKKSNQILNSFEDSIGQYKSMYNLQKAGLSLLERDFNLYNYYRSKFTYDNFAISDQEKALEEIFNNFKSHKKKSPYMAGLLSSLIPGLGKVYAGSYGEGVSSFLLIGSLGAITAENWIRNGLLNWKTIVFGTIGMVFYIGNIYGSISSVKIYYEDYNHKQNISILYNIHIPLRTLFN